MTTINTSTDQSTEACAVDRSCADSGCGCATPAGSDPVSTTSRKGLKAGLLAAACVIGCLAVPFAIGGAAAVSGALAGEAWLLVGLAVAATWSVSRWCAAAAPARSAENPGIGS